MKNLDPEILTMLAALVHLSREISSMLPWISVKSKLWLFNGTVSPKMALTSDNLLGLLVMKLSSVSGIVGYSNCFGMERK